MQALAVAIQDPHKNILVVFGNLVLAKTAFRMAIDELAKNLPDYPCQINYQRLVLTMAEGGRIHFMALEQRHDTQRILGYGFSTAIYDESWELVRNPDTRDYIRHIVAAHIR